MNHKFLAGLICLAILLVSALGFAQTATSGQVIGTVKDPTGAVVAGAKVTLTSATGEKREMTSDASGDFRFPIVPPGSYSLSVEAQGFKPMSADGVIVRVTETTELTANLRLAGAAESVNITAEAPLVQTSSPTAGRVIQEDQIKQLPLPTRNFQQLLALSPGAVAGLANNTEMGRGDALISVGGQRTTSNNVLVDGTEVNSAGTNGTGNISVPSPDSVQEFIVQTSMFDATTGRNAGGNIAVVTKSGTNTYHGSAFEFFRNEALNANDYFLKRAGRARPVLKRNQFGGTFGGAIVKDKTFFFVSYQGTRERNGASLSNSLTTVNLPGGLTDDRSHATLAGLATNWGATTLDPVAEKLLQAKLPNGKYAIPSGNGVAGTFVTTPISSISRFREDQFSANIDQQITATNRLSGKFFFSDTPQFQSLFTFAGANLFQLPGYGGSIDFHNRVFTLSDTHIFNPNLINEARVGYSRINGPSEPEEPFTAAQFGITNPLCAGNSNFCGMPTIGVSNMFTVGSTSLADQRSTVETFQYSDMLSWTHGKHFVRFGGDMRHYRVNFFFNFYSRGQLTFSNFASFLQGSGSPNGTLAPVVGVLGAGLRDRHYRSTDFNFYVQDDFRVSDSLTLNMGMRFGRNGGISDTDGRLSNFDPAEFAALSHACTSLNPCPSGNGFHLLSAGETLNPDDWTVAPRFGFSYKPTTAGLVFRGGAGVYFDRFSTRLANVQVFNYPTDVVSVTVNPPFANPFPNLANLQFPLAASVPSPVTYTAFNIPLPISGIYVDKNFRTPYVYQYNFGMQWEVKKNWLLDVGYVGTSGRKLINVVTLNQGATGTAPYNTASGAFGFLLSPAFSQNKLLTSGFQMAQSSATSSYNSLQTSLTKRFSSGLQFLASYTYSKSIDYNSGQVVAGNELNALPGDQQNMLSQRGVSDFDRTHRMVLSAMYEFPKFYKGDTTIAKRLFNDWQLSTIMTLQSGSPLTVICTSGTATVNRADLSGQGWFVPGAVDSHLDSYFNPAAFNNTCANVAPYGTSPRNFIRGPGQKNFDIGLVKGIPLTEKQKMEFRAEFFNAFNMVNFANPISTYTSGTKGALGRIISTSTGPRVIQFALKYSF
ncbi:MAG TPA: TonB-dependent receptor [Terriglobales bacterium]|nr:TonB-dependent receptor [Terriglobales bacterium]